MTALDWDITEINEINVQCCHMHYKDGSQEALHTPSIPTIVLQELLNIILHKKEYYAEMSRECSEICEARMEELQHINCPSQEEISKAGLLQRIDMELQKERYIEMVNKNSGINEIALMALNKHYKYWRLAKQFANVLDIRGIHVCVKY